MVQYSIYKDDLFDDRDDKISVFSSATTSGTVSRSIKLPAMYGTEQFNKTRFLGLFEEIDEVERTQSVA